MFSCFSIIFGGPPISFFFLFIFLVAPISSDLQMGLIYLLIVQEVMSCSLVLFLPVNFLNFLLLNAILTCLSNYFNPYISLNLEEFCIPISPYFSLDLIIHPFAIIVVSFASNSIMCPTINASCGCYYLLFPIVVVSFTSYFVMCPPSIIVSCAHDCVVSCS